MSSSIISIRSRRDGRLVRVVAAGGAAFLALYAAGLLVPSDSYHRFQSDLLYHVPALTALALLVRRLRPSSGRERFGWLCLVLLVGTWDAADWVFSYYGLVLGGEVPFPGLPDVLYYAGYLAFMTAIPLLVFPQGKLGDRRWVIDTAILMMAVGTLSWVYIIVPTAGAEGYTLLGAVVALGYPVLDLALVGAVTVTLLRAGSRFSRLAVLLAAPALVQVASDGVYTYLVLHNGFENTASLLDMGWLAGYVLLALAAVIPREETPIEVAPRRSGFGLVLPYVPPVPLAILALLSMQWDEPVSGLMAGTIATGALVVVRQILTLRDRSTVYEDLEHTVLLLATAAEAHDETTGRHLKGVRALSEAIARELGYTHKEASDLGLAAVLHDVGKFSVPDSLLSYPGPLDGDSHEVMKRHTTWGAEFLSGRPAFELSRVVALAHHERWDGTGYPRGLSGEEIPEPAAIVSVADAFDAMISERPYKEQMSPDDATQEVARCSGSQFSPRVVEAFLRLWRRGELPVEADKVPLRKAA